MSRRAHAPNKTLLSGYGGPFIRVRSSPCSAWWRRRILVTGDGKSCWAMRCVSMPFGFF